jgi:hypothetical protein
MKPYLDKFLSFTASALSEENGQRSCRRVILAAAIFAAIFFSAGLLIKHPELSVDLIKFVIMNAVALFGITRGAEIFKGPPPPVVPAA